MYSLFFRRLQDTIRYAMLRILHVVPPNSNILIHTKVPPSLGAVILIPDPQHVLTQPANAWAVLLTPVLVLTRTTPSAPRAATETALVAIIQATVLLLLVDYQVVLATVTTPTASKKMTAKSLAFVPSVEFEISPIYR